MAGFEHLGLERGAVAAGPLDGFGCRGLHDEVNVTPRSSGVRPQRDVDLLRGDEFVDDRGRLLQQWPELLRLVRREFADAHHVPDWFYEEGTEPERADAVLDD